MLAVTAAIKRSKLKRTMASAFMSAQANRAKTARLPAINFNSLLLATRRAFESLVRRRISGRCRAREVFPGDARSLRRHPLWLARVSRSRHGPLQSRGRDLSPSARFPFLRFRPRSSVFLSPTFPAWRTPNARSRDQTRGEQDATHVVQPRVGKGIQSC